MLVHPSMFAIRKVLDRKGYVFFDKGDYNLNIIAVRSENSQSNEFDDWMHVIFKDGQRWVHETYACTTDPGKYYLVNPLNTKGCAIVVPDQYGGAFKIGTHGRSWASGGYEALEQVRPMHYVRDYNLDTKLSLDLYRNNLLLNTYGEWVNAKTNIHRASRWNKVPLIGRYSAGCQVIQDYKDFKDMMLLCKLQVRQKHGNRFTYTLLEERDF